MNEEVIEYFNDQIIRMEKFIATMSGDGELKLRLQRSLNAYKMALKALEQQPKGHRRRFEEIVVEYPPADLCTYPEYRGKPYFSIKYEENGEHIIGFGTYKPEVLSSYIREYFVMGTEE